MRHRGVPSSRHPTINRQRAGQVFPLSINLIRRDFAVLALRRRWRGALPKLDARGLIGPRDPIASTSARAHRRRVRPAIRGGPSRARAETAVSRYIAGISRASNSTEDDTWPVNTRANFLYRARTRRSVSQRGENPRGNHTTRN